MNQAIKVLTFPFGIYKKSAEYNKKLKEFKSNLENASFEQGLNESVLMAYRNTPIFDSSLSIATEFVTYGGLAFAGYSIATQEDYLAAAVIGIGSAIIRKMSKRSLEREITSLGRMTKILNLS